MLNHLAVFIFRDRLCRGIIRLAMIIFVATLLVPSAYADLDINAVAGQVLIDGVPAVQGTFIEVRDVATGTTITTEVDGPNVPSFMRGEGRYDTGDVSQFNTGDTVIVTVQDSSVFGQASAVLQAGTTTVNLNAHRDKPPSIGYIPRQTGFEDVSWELDMDPYLSDPDTPVSSLKVKVYNSHVTVQGHMLRFLYPEGILQDTILVYVQDGSSTVSRHVEVMITPVNDPPNIGEIPTIALMEGGNTSIDLSIYITDPDDEVSSLTWQVLSGEFVDAWIEGTYLTVAAPELRFGTDYLLLIASDLAGLSDNQTLEVDVSANLTALTEFYKDQISQLNSNIALLNSQIASLTEENSNLSDRVGVLMEVISSVDCEKEDLQDLLDEAQQSASQLSNQLEGMNIQSELDEETIALLELDRMNLSTQIASLEQAMEMTITSYRSVIWELNSTKMEYKAQIMVLNEKIVEIDDVLSQLESNGTLHQELIANLTHEKNKFQSLIGAKDQEIQKLDQLAMELEGQISELEEDKSQADMFVEEIGRSLEDLRQRNSDLLYKIDELTKRALAHPVGVNNTSNMSSIDQSSLVESLFARVAHLARGGTSLISRGMKSTLGILVVAVIVAASTISIGLRIYSVQPDLRPGDYVKASRFWHGTKGRGNSMREVESPGSHAGSAGKDLPSAKSRLDTTLGGSKPKDERAISTGVLLGSFVRRTKAIADRKYPKSGGETTKPAHQVSAKKVTTPKAMRSKTSRPQKISRGIGRLTGRSDRKDLALRLDSSSLSREDREYIKILIKLGYNKEAEEEFRKRSSSR